MKRMLAVVLGAAILTTGLAGCAGNDDAPRPTDPPAYEENQVIYDRGFETGFNLLGLDSFKDERTIYRFLDYGGTARPTINDEKVWYLAQWGEKTSLEFAEEKKLSDGTYVYEDEGKKFTANPDTGQVTLNLTTSKTYEKPRESAAEPWSHMLIEQNFAQMKQLNKIKEIDVNVKFKLTQMDCMMDPSEINEDLHAAQLLWYFVIQNRPDLTGGSGGEVGDYIWLGVPLYDTRHPVIKQACQSDTGTGRFIYGISSGDYLIEQPQVGKAVDLKLDIRPYMEEAFATVQGKGGMKNAKFENLVFTYMNFGFEVPGIYDVGVEVNGISVELK